LVERRKRKKERRKRERKKERERKKTPVARLEPKAAQNALTRYLSRDNRAQTKKKKFPIFHLSLTHTTGKQI
jgi:hypothetical protein